MSMPNLTRQWTLDDIHALPEDNNRYEVIDGELFVSPSPRAEHQVAVQMLYVSLAEYLKREPIGFTYVAPLDVMYDQRNSVQPDLFVVPLVGGKRPRRILGRDLLLAIEVLSPSTARADRVTKRALFQREGLPDYWIVDLDSRTIERSTLDNARPEILADSVEWFPQGASEPLRIDLEPYFATVWDELALDDVPTVRE